MYEFLTYIERNNETCFQLIQTYSSGGTLIFFEIFAKID